MAIFYSIIIVSLLIPIVGGLYIRRADGAAALASIVAGLVTLFGTRIAVTPDYRWADPLLAGILAAAFAFFAVMAIRRSPGHVGSVQAG